MSKIQNSIAYVTTGKGFDDYRNKLIEIFDGSSAVHKKKMTQGLFWTSVDKDLANQMVREERWFLGVKYKDEIRVIDHGTSDDSISNKGVGFKK